MNIKQEMKECIAEVMDICSEYLDMDIPLIEQSHIDLDYDDIIDALEEKFEFDVSCTELMFDELTLNESLDIAVELYMQQK